MMGAFKEVLMSGEKSRQGLTSLELAVLEPPGDWMGGQEARWAWPAVEAEGVEPEELGVPGMWSSLGIMSERPVALEDFTMARPKLPMPRGEEVEPEVGVAKPETTVVLRRAPPTGMEAGEQNEQV